VGPTEDSLGQGITCMYWAVDSMKNACHGLRSTGLIAMARHKIMALVLQIHPGKGTDLLQRLPMFSKVMIDRTGTHASPAARIVQR
jgi:hypothetical protein